ncbi:MAG: Spy/CpxP family protein refolding chaperone [Verrucomicrobiota bacterium]
MRTNRGLICAAAIGMLVAGVACSASGETNATTQRPHEGQDFGGRFMAVFEQLNLTADQSQQIASIMRLNQESIKTAMIKVKDTREALNHQIQAGPFDEQSIRAACKKAAAAEEEAAVLRAKVAGQIHTVLTSDQQAALDKIRADRQNTMHKRFRQRRGGMDK